MSTSETITRTDLTNILNEVLPIPQGAYFDLVWTNPNGNSQTSTMGASDITINKSRELYDGFMIEFRCFYNAGDKTYGFNFMGMSGLYSRIMATRTTGNPIYEYARTWYPSAEYKITMSDCTRIMGNNANITGEDTGCLVPIRIWGICLKASGVTPFQADYIVEQGTSGIWTYRKWNSGIAECWGKTSVESNTYAANGGYKNIVQALPSGLFNATPNSVIASGRITTLVQTSMGFTSADSANQVQTYLINRGTSAITQAGEVYWLIKGTWK